MNNAEIDDVDLNHFGLTVTKVFEVISQHNSILRCFEVAMNQMNIKNFVNVMTNEESCKLLYLFLRNEGLFRIVEQFIVASNC